MHDAKSLVFGAFGAGDPISVLDGQFPRRQSRYLLSYLGKLGAKTFILEPNYFDLDYLDEFSSFYSSSSRGYPNICRRVHFFADARVGRALFMRALAGKNSASATDRTTPAGADVPEPNADGAASAALTILQESYLGFSVLKPIRHPFGRTVLAWYPDQTPEQARVTTPARNYECHLAGLKLTVKGLAWQQQDSAVASCATVGVWSILHSSAIDHRHAIPTTAQITLAANAAVKIGKNAFPSTGLQVEELLEAIKHQNLNPIKIDGDLQPKHNGRRFFSREKFASACSAFIRSGYPVLLLGDYDLNQPSGHAVCAVGFRDAIQPPQTSKPLSLMDENIPYIYLHDDNYGPNIRFNITLVPLLADGSDANICQLVSAAPSSVKSTSTLAQPIEFTPRMLVVATHQELRLSSPAFYLESERQAQDLLQILKPYLERTEPSTVQLSYGCRFMLLKSYLSEEVALQIPDSTRRASVRLSLQEQVVPMSLHIGILRVSLLGTSVRGSSPLLDIIYDTTEASPSTPFCCVAYHEAVNQIFVTEPDWAKSQLGTKIVAY